MRKVNQIPSPARWAKEQIGTIGIVIKEACAPHVVRGIDSMFLSRYILFLHSYLKASESLTRWILVYTPHSAVH